MRFGGYIKFAILVIAVPGVVALATPQHTSTALRVALFLLAATTAVALLDVAHRRSPEPVPSPFEPRHRPAPPSGPPADIVRLAVELRAFDAATEQGTVPTVVPGALRRSMRTIAGSRLAARPQSTMPPLLHAALDGDPVVADADELVATLESL
jgi:hypothetical protein